MNQKIQEMVENGFAAKRIANKLCLPFPEVKACINENSLKIKKEKFDESKISEIINLYKDGVSAKNLGIKYSIDKRRVQKWVREKGLERSRSESHRLTFFDENYFDEIDTPNKAYWLGFFYADAYNCSSTNTISLGLSYKDCDQLVKLAAAVNLPPEKVFKGTSSFDDKKYPTANLKLYSKHMCNSLTEKGCPQAKSFIIKYPDWLNPDLHSHFIRGMFDGDGCLTFRKKQKEWKFSIVSTKECCESISYIFNKELNLDCSVCCISQTENNTYLISTGGNEKIHTIMKWLYDDSTSSIRLTRKFIKYEQLIDQQNNRQFMSSTNRTNYLLDSTLKKEISESRDKVKDIAKKFDINTKTVWRIKNKTNFGFINKYTYRCLLGPRSQDIKEIDDIYFWRVGSRHHFSTSKVLTKKDIELLIEQKVTSFHYLSKYNLDNLKKVFTISNSKYSSPIIDITDLSFKGGKYKKLRQAINKCNKNDLEILDKFKDISDIKKMINAWSNNCAEKYFRDFSGKNYHFYKEGYHSDCINIFIYFNDELVSFGSLSPPINFHSSYIIGKALYNKLPGLSEYTDVELYKKAAKLNVKTINMGRSDNKNLKFYKTKFPLKKEIVSYAGSIKI